MHLEMLYEVGGLTPERFQHFYHQYRKLGSMLYNYRKAVIQGRI